MDEFLRELFDENYCYLCGSLLSGCIFPQKYHSEEKNFNESPIMHLLVRHRDVFIEIFDRNESYCPRCGQFAESNHDCNNLLSFHSDLYFSAVPDNPYTLPKIRFDRVNMCADLEYELADELRAILLRFVDKEIIPDHKLQTFILAGSIGSHTAISTSDIDILIELAPEYDNKKLISRELKEFIIKEFPHVENVRRLERKEFCQVECDIEGVHLDITYVFDKSKICTEMQKIEIMKDLRQNMAEDEFHMFLQGKEFIAWFIETVELQYSKFDLVNCFGEEFLKQKNIKNSLIIAFSALGEAKSDALLKAFAQLIQKCVDE